MKNNKIICIFLAAVFFFASVNGAIGQVDLKQEVDNSIEGVVKESNAASGRSIIELTESHSLFGIPLLSITKIAVSQPLEKGTRVRFELASMGPLESISNLIKAILGRPLDAKIQNWEVIDTENRSKGEEVEEVDEPESDVSYKLQGHIYNSKGDPISDVEIKLMSDTVCYIGYEPPMIVSSESGYYEIEGHSNEGTIYVESSGYKGAKVPYNFGSDCYVMKKDIVLEEKREEEPEENGKLELKIVRVDIEKDDDGVTGIIPTIALTNNNDKDVVFHPENLEYTITAKSEELSIDYGKQSKNHPTLESKTIPKSFMKPLIFEIPIGSSEDGDYTLTVTYDGISDSTDFEIMQKPGLLSNAFVELSNDFAIKSMQTLEKNMDGGLTMPVWGWGLTTGTLLMKMMADGETELNLDEGLNLPYYRNEPYNLQDEDLYNEIKKICNEKFDVNDSEIIMDLKTSADVNKIPDELGWFKESFKNDFKEIYNPAIQKSWPFETYGDQQDFITKFNERIEKWTRGLIKDMLTEEYVPYGDFCKGEQPLSYHTLSYYVWVRMEQNRLMSEDNEDTMTFYTKNRNTDSGIEVKCVTQEEYDSSLSLYECDDFQMLTMDLQKADDGSNGVMLSFIKPQGGQSALSVLDNLDHETFSMCLNSDSSISGTTNKIEVSIPFIATETGSDETIDLIPLMYEEMFNNEHYPPIWCKEGANMESMFDYKTISETIGMKCNMCGGGDTWDTCAVKTHVSNVLYKADLKLNSMEYEAAAVMDPLEPVYSFILDEPFILIDHTANEHLISFILTVNEDVLVEA